MIGNQEIRNDGDRITRQQTRGMRGTTTETIAGSNVTVRDFTSHATPCAQQAPELAWGAIRGKASVQHGAMGRFASINTQSKVLSEPPDHKSTTREEASSTKASFTELFQPFKIREWTSCVAAGTGDTCAVSTNQANFMMLPLGGWPCKTVASKEECALGLFDKTLMLKRTLLRHSKQSKPEHSAERETSSDAS